MLLLGILSMLQIKLRSTLNALITSWQLDQVQTHSADCSSVNKKLHFICSATRMDPVLNHLRVAG